MNIMKYRILLSCLLTITFLVAGCAAWVRVEQPLAESPDKSFTVELPVGWMRQNNLMFNGIAVTRDGFGLQSITAMKLAHDKAFPTIKKISNAEMLPTELAELALAELKTQDDLSNLEVISKKPAQIADRDAFRLHVRTKNKRGLAVDRVIYGFADKNGFYLLDFEAPRLHYFERDLPAFEKTAKSMKLRNAGA